MLFRTRALGRGGLLQSEPGVDLSSVRDGEEEEEDVPLWDF